MARTANAVWQGSLKEGKGTISTGSGLLKDAQYSFQSRFEDGVGTTPEELIAAAHASCFTMAFGAELGKAGFTPERLETKADVSFAVTDGKPTVTKIALSSHGKVPNVTDEQFQQAAETAKANCPISRLFQNNTQITMEAKLDK